MNLTARCHSLRPDRTSGWLTYFELAEHGPRAGHFLVVGPGAARQPEQIQAALRAGQAAVRYLKEVPAHAPPLTLLEATARILDHEREKTETDLEFGCAVLEGRELWLLTRGAVRLVALAPEPGVPFGAGRPHAVSVEAGERYFLGRVPETVEAATSEELRARLERGGGDGGLVLRLAASDRLQALGPRSPDDEEPIYETVEPRTAPSKPVEAPQEPAPHFEALPPRPATPPPPPAQVPAPKPRTEPPAPKARAEPPASKARAGPPVSKARSEPAAPKTAPQPPAHPAPAVSVASEPSLSRESAPAGDASFPEVEAPRSVESRGLVFWLGIVAAVFALSALLVYLFAVRPQIRRSAEPNPPAKQTAPAESLRGSLPPPAPTGPLRIAWQARMKDAITSSPLVAGDRVIFGCRDGRVYALRATGGDSIWAFTAKDGFGASPLRCGNSLVIGSYEGIVYALDLETGARRWSVPTQGRIVASAVADSTNVYVGSYDHHLYAITLADGAVRWKRDLGGVLWASPILTEGQIVAAGLDGRVSAVDAATGRVRWTTSLGGPIYSSPASGKGRVFVGTREGDVVALDAGTGSRVWKADAGDPVNGATAFEAGWVVVGNEAGTILGVEAETGRVQWRTKTGGEVRSRPAVSGGRVWVTGYDGVLRQLELESGKELASISVGASLFSSPALNGHAVYFGALDGRFLSVEIGAPAS